jgi:hypothetical protein
VSLDAKTRAGARLSYQNQVLAMLKRAGHAGATTEDLLTIHHRFSASIFELRAKGWPIVTLDRPGTDNATFVLRPGTYADTPKQADLMRPPMATPSKPVAFFGLCACGHTAGQHRAHGAHACFDCTCTTFTPVD